MAACKISVHHRYICRHLRPHQREGVAFMYTRVQGPSAEGQNGAILADAMGLGCAASNHVLLVGPCLCNWKNVLEECIAHWYMLELQQLHTFPRMSMWLINSGVSDTVSVFFYYIP